jgi:hypothetical protein
MDNHIKQFSTPTKLIIKEIKNQEVHAFAIVGASNFKTHFY